MEKVSPRKKKGERRHQKNNGKLRKSVCIISPRKQTFKKFARGAFQEEEQCKAMTKNDR